METTARRRQRRDTLICSLTREPHLTVTRNSLIVEQLGKNTYLFNVDLPRGKTVIIEVEPPSRALIYFAIFLASLQIMDGMLTSIGMARFGINNEGNPFLRTLMMHMDPDKALVVVKTAAVLLVVSLSVVARHLSWVRDLIGVLSCVYLFAAIIPWVYVITYHF
jgi:hypothetical protein